LLDVNRERAYLSTVSVQPVDK